MQRRLISALALATAVGTCAPALAQSTTTDRDRQNQNQTRQTQPDRTIEGELNPEGTRPERAGARNGQAGSQTGQADRGQRDSYGTASRGTDLHRLNDLAGAWRITCTKYNTDSESGDVGTVTGTTNGFAERRWALDGKQLIECYVVDGSPADLPLNLGSQMGYGAQGQNNWGADRSTPGQTGRDNNMNNTGRDSGLTQPGATGQTGRDGATGQSGRDAMGQSGTAGQSGRDGATGQSGRDANSPSGTAAGQSGRDAGTTQADRDLASRNNQDRNNPNRDQTGINRDRPGMNNQALGASGMQEKWELSGGKKGIILWGYDEAADAFNVAWTDSSTSAIRFDTGELDNNNTLTLEGKCVDPRNNETYQTKTVIHIISPDQQKVTMYRDGGIFEAETKVAEIVYTRDNSMRTTMNSQQSTLGTNRVEVRTDRP